MQQLTEALEREVRERLRKEVELRDSWLSFVPGSESSGAPIQVFLKIGGPQETAGICR